MAHCKKSNLISCFDAYSKLLFQIRAERETGEVENKIPEIIRPIPRREFIVLNYVSVIKTVRLHSSAVSLLQCIHIHRRFSPHSGS